MSSRCFLAQKINKTFDYSWKRNQTRDFIHVYDLVKAIVKSGKSKNMGKSNVGSGKKQKKIAGLISKNFVNIPKRLVSLIDLWPILQNKELIETWNKLRRWSSRSFKKNCYWKKLQFGHQKI